MEQPIGYNSELVEQVDRLYIAADMAAFLLFNSLLESGKIEESS